MQNTKCDNKLRVISAREPVKNTFVIGLDTATVLVGEVSIDMSQCINNSAADGPSTQKNLQTS